MAASISAFAAQFTLARLVENPPVLVGVVPLFKVQTYAVLESYKSASSLYGLAIEWTAFDVALTVANDIEWVFTSLLFSGCYIISANPSSVTVGTTSGQLDTVPVATFSGIITKSLGSSGNPLMQG